MAGSGRRLLSVRAAAQAAACSNDTIRRHIREGRLQALRLGAAGDYRIPADALDRWLTPTETEETTHATH